MQIERLMARAITRLARSGLSNLRPAQIAPAAAGSSPSKPRGSGSWANEWMGARSAVERAKSLARPGKTRKSAGVESDEIPDGTVRIRPLMSARGLRLHNWIADRLEEEAPTCSLHAGVALSSFLTAATAHEGHDPLAGLVADLLIVDETGKPIAALVRDYNAEPERHLKRLDALLDADLPIIDIPARPTLSSLWAEISAALPQT